MTSSQQAGQGGKQDDQAQPEDKTWRPKKKMGWWVTRGAMGLQDNYQVDN